MVGFNKPRILVIFGCIVYLATLVVLYVLVISPTYSYYTFTYTEPPWLLFVTTCVIGLLPSLWLPADITRPSQVASWLLYLFVVLPSCIIPLFTLDRLNPLEILSISGVVVSSFVIMGFVSRLPIKRFGRHRLHSRIFWGVFGMITLVLLVQFLIGFGSRLRLVSFLEVYDLRAEFVDAIATTNSFIGYSISWMTYVIGPAFLALGMIRRNLLFLVLGVVIEFLVYSAAGFRIAPMVILLVVGLIVLLRFFGSSRLGIAIVWTFVGLVVLCIAIGLIFENAYIPFLLVGRPILMPGLLTGFYYEFFSLNPKAMLGYSIFRGVFAYPYDLLPPNLIGIAYFQNPATFANASIWADSYANFGFIGMYVFAALLGGVLWFFDSVTNEGNFVLSCALMGVCGFVFANSAFLTTLLTHGIWLMMALLLLVPQSVASNHGTQKKHRLMLGWRFM